jgi:hypothetical protein
MVTYAGDVSGHIEGCPESCPIGEPCNVTDDEIVGQVVQHARAYSRIERGEDAGTIDRFRQVPDQIGVADWTAMHAHEQTGGMVA